MAEGLRRGLQILARRFDSGSGLHPPRKAQAAVVGRIKTVEQRRRPQQAVRAGCKSLSRRQFLHPFPPRPPPPTTGGQVSRYASRRFSSSAEKSKNEPFSLNILAPP